MAADIELNGLLGGGTGEGGSPVKSGEGADTYLREVEKVNASQQDTLEKNGLLEASDVRLKSAMVEVVRLTGELDGNVELLNECQVSKILLR